MLRIISSPYFVLGLLASIIVANFLALWLGWYYANPDSHIDTIYHFVGGVWVTSAFFYFFRRYPHLFDIWRNRMLTITFATSFVVLVGVGWELFEFVLDYISEIYGGLHAQGDLQDTMGDLALDIFGALATSSIALFPRKDQ